ncbi:High-temperature-induced dauer-formation protein, putative [Trypanosoma equiperdum]|uniref:Dymeclin n=2 Tax=Trypanozoon TaxID=39700 RepID=Q57TS7_TRYB2|nr:hypothetical protein, conserved [Trypanosoma brucei brucei TREU927]AAX80047.1 hypothetical protein, conserved [Trypanosoma brucei]AAZ13450.1 hypothetical protein, conserved [Trypanosoma brucei brucei TREU927]SCU67731.1 High-temperature-induced dauer-formation protein, putative [Trypanosoma equiperdum]
MGTSGSTIDVARALRTMTSDVPISDGVLQLLLDTPLSHEELQRALPFHTLRTMRHCYTRNFALLLLKCVEVLANTAASCRSSNSKGQVVGVQPFLNALRVMRRILPIAMEDGGTPCEEVDGSSAEVTGSSDNSKADGGDAVPMQASSKALRDKRKRTAFTEMFVQSFFARGCVCNDEQPEETFPPLPGQSEPLGKFLVRLLLDCCFLEGLGAGVGTTPTETSGCTHSDVSLLWYSGVAGQRVAAESKAVTATTHAVRHELLGTLTVLLSYPLLLPPNTPDVFFTEVLLSPENASLLKPLVASTLNALLSYVPYGLLPYTSYWVGEEEDVVLMSARFLSSVICYPSAPVGNTGASCECDQLEDGSAASGVAVSQGARDFFRCLTREEATHIVHNLQNIVGLRLYAKRTYLPDSQRRFAASNESMMLLWRLIDLSPACSQAFGCEQVTLKYILPLVDYALDARRSPRLSSRLQLVLFILMRLTGSSSFCLQCNTPFRESIPFSFDTFVGTYNDLIVITLCYFLLMPHHSIRLLSPMCSAVISNMAPFVTTVSPVTAEKLSLVFTSVATRCLAYESVLSASSAAVENNVVVADEVTMVNVVETVCDVVQRRATGAAGLLSAFVPKRGLIENVAEVFGTRPNAEKEDGQQQHPSFHFTLTSPFMVNTLLAAVATANEAAHRAECEGGDRLAAIQGTVLEDHTPRCQRTAVKRLDPSWDMEIWSFVNHWYSMYQYSAPGSYGDSKSIKMLRFR